MAPIVYSPRYEIDIGAHVFPTRKYRLIRDHLVARGFVSDSDVIEPVPASWEDLGLVHTADYLRKLREGTLSPEEQAQMEIPWSAEVVEGFRLMTGGTLLAARIALGEAMASPVPAASRSSGSHRPWRVTRHFGVNIGGGFHHASEDHGEGFCMFNDVAVAARALVRRGSIARAAVVDCDVHHGNGTAFIFAGDRTVFTFSIHQANNYPAFKPHGSLDIHLADYTDDESYLRQLAGALPRVMASAPDLVFYVAGGDPFEDDQLGGLSLTKAGLRRRDRLVFSAARELGVPVVVTLAGGYARRLEDTVEIQAGTIEEGLRAFGE